eukprot:18442-Heterococcus_DN1.PRE.1
MEHFALHHDMTGRPFRSRRFTNLRYCAQTVRLSAIYTTSCYAACGASSVMSSEGLELEAGFIQFRQLLTYATDVSPVPKMLAAVTDDTPLSITYKSVNGKAVAGPELSHKDTLAKEESWSAVAKLLNKQFIEL